MSSRNIIPSYVRRLFTDEDPSKMSTAEKVGIILQSKLGKIKELNIDNVKPTTRIFRSKSRPQFKLVRLLINLVYLMKLDKNTIVAMLIYIGRALYTDKFLLQEMNYDKVIISAAIVANKYVSNISSNLELISFRFGLSKAILFKTEIELLKLMNYRCYISTVLYERINGNLVTDFPNDIERDEDNTRYNSDTE